MDAYSQYFGIHQALKAAFPGSSQCPALKVLNYNVLATAPQTPYIEGRGSKWLVIAPEVIHPGQDAASPDCYQVPNLYADPGEPIADMQLRIFTSPIEACASNPQGKPVVPWVAAPGAVILGVEFQMTKEVCLAMLNAAYDGGIREVILWSNFWLWDDLLWVIEQFNATH